MSTSLSVSILQTGPIAPETENSGTRIGDEGFSLLFREPVVIYEIS